MRNQQLGVLQQGSQSNEANGYLTALDTALNADPNNIQLLILRGSASQSMGTTGAQQSLLYFKRILALDPENPVAHHYLAHSYEMLNDIPRAMEHARAFLRSAPALPHAHHMYGHELLRSGQIKSAISQFEKADQLEEASFKTNPKARTQDWHYRHNLNLLATAYRIANQPSKAETVLQQLAKLPTVSEVDEYYAVQLPAFYLLRGDFDGARRSIHSLPPTHSAVGNTLRHAIRGSSEAALSQWRLAEIDLSAARAYFREVPLGWHPFLQPWITTLKTQLMLDRDSHEAVSEALLSASRNCLQSPGTDEWADSVLHLEYLAGIGCRNHLRAVVLSIHKNLQTLGASTPETARAARHGSCK
ncbi:MAG TPA: hypothetical protein VFW31_09845 [Candidatus Angelobacter sp.]|nr:hypothetical protein [Candidatus Angelobacter sp.]